MHRILLVSAGFLFLGLGIIGIFLPLLPTTPFVLIAAWCFSKSSKRLHHWLLSRPHLGPIVIQWEAYGVIPRRAKFLSVTMMTLMVSYPLIYSPMPLYLKGIVVLTCLSALVFVLSRPSMPPEQIVVPEEKKSSESGIPERAKGSVALQAEMAE